ncbi:branched-chain amino acid aminotransferase [Chrysiogenes arsenatis]|uniref:branched-chain amino acid aminotransferase n=1 Tax=Chrysiogenes arsenatis TaxID=309797 RepID=UPI000413C56D|nr:branched-chain amino acid aminotransferase [Chrysiogenes arsenatis]
MSTANMIKANLDWANLGFQYRDTGWRYRAKLTDGVWHEEANPTKDMVISEGSQAINYGQQCFEGMKAYTTINGDVVVFRPDMNFARLNQSAARLLMDPIPEEIFMGGLQKLIDHNLAYVPPYGHGASLYIRPLYIGIGDNLGLKPASEYIFTIYCSPVGPYYKNGFKPISLMVSSYDRAAPHGTGNVKVGGNYAAGLIASREAKNAGFDDAIFLDAATRRYIDEAGTSNFFGITADGTLVTPASSSILESITRISLTEVALFLGMNVESRPVALEELGTFVEAGCCGTAAVVTPIGKITSGDRSWTFGDGINAGAQVKKLYDTLIDIQNGKEPAFARWLTKMG